MDLYFELLKHPVFTMKDLLIFYNNIESARTAVKRLLAKGMVVKIRRNLYTCISGETGVPIANHYQIASTVTATSYVTHHTAMEYYGITDQVFYDVYVASETVFQDFEFDGCTFQYVKSKFLDGVDTVKYSGGVRVTDKERTLLDCIKDMDKIAGAEEVVGNIQSMNRIEEEKLVHYLDLYQNQFLYQKTGYILQKMKKEMRLSDAFFELCKKKAGKSTRYLSSDYQGGVFDAEWKLVVPEILFQAKNGVIFDADV